MLGRNHREVVDGLAAKALQAVYTHADPVDRIEALKPVIASAVADPYWLSPLFRRVQGAGTYYLLWTDRESGVSLLAMALGPGDVTPIHDHLTWGVVGVYDGTQFETRYRGVDDRLSETSARSRGAGSVTHLLAPEEDIHSVRSESLDTSTISVFFMGRNIGCTSRHIFDLDGGVETVVSGYANKPCEQQTRSPFFVSQFM